MLLAIVEFVAIAIERLGIAFLLIFAIMGIGAVRCNGQVVYASEPTLAPAVCLNPSCDCLVCKCNPCQGECPKPKPVVSVKKSTVTTPDRASIRIVSSFTKDSKTYNTLASGTVIDSKDGKSTVLTCWHLLREPGDLKVYCAGGNSAPARVVKSDSKLDLAILEFDGEMDYAPVANQYANSNLTAYGFDGTEKLHSASTRVTRQYNYPNQEIAGRTPQGRSGGGLFDSSGKLVGVCSAGTSTYGVYITHPAIEVFLYGKSTLKQSQSKPAPPLIVAPRQQAITGPVFSNCPNGQCSKAPSPKPLGKVRDTPVMSPAGGCVNGRCWK